MEKLPEAVRDLIEKPAIATFASLLPTGHPHVVPVWVDHDGTHVLVVSRKETRKFRNVESDPRVTVTILDPDYPYRYADVRGEVDELIEDGAIEVSDRLATRYWGVDEYPFARDAPRVVFRVRPDRVHAQDVDTPDHADV